MDIGILTVKGPDYHPNRRLMETGASKGLLVGLIDPRRVSPSILDGRAGSVWQETAALPGVALTRQGAQITESSLVVLAHLESMGVVLINSRKSVLAAKNKFTSLGLLAENGIPVPDTVFVNTEEAFFRGIETLGGYPVVCKKTSGRKGRGVFMADNPGEAEDMIERHLIPAEGLLMQRFIAPAGRRDFRVLVIDGKVAAAMEMRPPEGDFRSNYAITGKSRIVFPDENVSHMAVQCTLGLGLDIAGVDILDSPVEGRFVIEANSAPGFRGLEKATGLDIAAMIIDYAAARLAGKSTRA